MSNLQHSQPLENMELVHRLTGQVWPLQARRFRDLGIDLLSLAITKDKLSNVYSEGSSVIIPVGSHYHFVETNAAYGKRLNISARTALRFEPGDIKTVTLCSIAGAKIISGGNNIATGVVEFSWIDGIVNSLLQRSFGHIPEPGTLE
ncbi:hypothetical protein H0H92_009879, partial [Tricholoma furcatifolium]